MKLMVCFLCTENLEKENHTLRPLNFKLKFEVGDKRNYMAALK